MNISTD